MLMLAYGCSAFSRQEEAWAKIKSLLVRWRGRRAGGCPDHVIRLAVRCVTAADMRGFFRHASVPGVPSVEEEAAAARAAAIAAGVAAWLS